MKSYRSSMQVCFARLVSASGSSDSSRLRTSVAGERLSPFFTVDRHMFDSTSPHCSDGDFENSLPSKLLAAGPISNLKLSTMRKDCNKARV